MRLPALPLLLLLAGCAMKDDAFEGADTAASPRAVGPLAAGGSVRAEGVLVAGDTDTLSVDAVPPLHVLELALVSEGHLTLTLAPEGQPFELQLGGPRPTVRTPGRSAPLVLVVRGGPEDEGPYAVEVKDLGPLPEEPLEENDTPHTAAACDGAVDLLVKDDDWVKVAAPRGARARIRVTGAPGGLLTVMSDALRTLAEPALTPEVVLEVGPLEGDEAGLVIGLRPAGQPPFTARLVVEVLSP